MGIHRFTMSEINADLCPPDSFHNAYVFFAVFLTVVALKIEAFNVLPFLAVNAILISPKEGILLTAV